jgi:hypothetical protein
MSSLENVNPGMRPRFLSQKIEAWKGGAVQHSSTTPFALPTTNARAQQTHKRPGKEDALDGSERDQPLTKRGPLVRDPLERPVGLFRDARDGLDRVEQVGTTSWVLDVRVDEERVGFRVDVLPVASEAKRARRAAERRGHGAGDVTTRETRKERREERRAETERAIDGKPQDNTAKTHKNAQKRTQENKTISSPNQKKEKKWKKEQTRNSSMHTRTHIMI